MCLSKQMAAGQTQQNWAHRVGPLVRVHMPAEQCKYTLITTTAEHDRAEASSPTRKDRHHNVSASRMPCRHATLSARLSAMHPMQCAQVHAPGHAQVDAGTVEQRLPDLAEAVCGTNEMQWTSVESDTKGNARATGTGQLLTMPELISS